MYRSILVPLDGSMFAEQSLPMALNIACRTGAAIDLVRVHAIYAMEEPESRWLPFDTAEDTRLREQEQAYLDAIAGNIGKVGSVPVTTAVVNGSLVESILEHAQVKSADLIVMTTHGRGPLSRFWLGSVADQLVRHTPHPVLLIRPQETPRALDQGPALRRVLIPLDGSELAERVLEPAIALCSSADTEYTLIRVVKPALHPDGSVVPPEPSGIAHPSLEKGRTEAEAYLVTVAERLRATGARVHTQIVVGKPPAAAILDVARDQGMELIALATHGRGGVKRLLLGSVADKIVRGTHTPILLYRPMDGHKPARA